jgi:Flp pilus assembly protein TadD
MNNFPLVRCPEQGFNRYSMRVWNMTAVAALALGLIAANSFAADNVAPTRAELEEMYNAAYKAFDSDKFSEALKQLDAIDARQPDLAASKNLRGVILMRQGNYDQAETALQDAARIDPKFWNARFNLAEIPFLKKDWAEARKRFEQMLSTGGPDLAKEASQLIQYKILLTYLMEGKGNMVDSILAKLELTPDTPAVDYVKAAVALQQKNQNEAKDWINAAEKNFSPQLNKLFAESLYEVGWLEKPAGTARPSLPLMTAAERTEKTKAAARSKFEQSQQALHQRDFATALKLVDQADQAEPNQPATLNLRGEILMQQQQFDQAEAAFKKAAKLDPKFREAQYNLAQIPFKKKDYSKAQERFETLYKRTPGGDKNQAAELIKFKIYMTLLLQGKESRAHAMMEEFQFTGDTPALYYAQAAWEYKHNNPEKAADWTGSANKIYSPALNSVFEDAFYDVGWMQRPEGSTTAPALAFDTTNAGASQAEGAPAVEPSPIPDRVFAANKQGETVKTESLAFSDLAANNPNTGTEGTTLGTTAEQSAVSAPSEPLAGRTSAQLAQTPSPGGSPGAAASPSEEAAAVATGKAEQSPTAAIRPSPSAVGKAPAKILASALGTSVTGFVTSHRTWLVGGLLLAGMLFLGGAVVSQGRRYTFTTPGHFSNGSRIESRVSNPSEPSVLSVQNGISSDNRFLGGPRQVSLRLTASKPSMQRTALGLIESRSAFDGVTDLRGTVPQTPVSQNAEADHKIHRVPAPVLGTRAASIVAEASLSSFSSRRAAESDQTRGVAETIVAPVVEPAEEPQFAAIDQVQPVAHMLPPTERPSEIPAVAEVVATPATEPVAAAMTEPLAQEQAISQVPPRTEEPSALPVVAEVAATPATEPVGAAMAEPLEQEQAIPQVPPRTEEPGALPVVAEVAATPSVEPAAAAAMTEPLAQGQAIPQVRANGMEPSTAEAVHEVRSYVPEPVSSPSKIATPATMSETTQTPLVPMTKAPAPPVAKPQPPPGTTHTTVELTFSFEVASVQLTPAFKVGALQVRPASKVVTMRLGPFQDSQPVTNSEVAFEIAKIALAGDGLGKIQVVRSQQQKPLANGSPSFAIAGLQFVPNLRAAPIWLTPSQEGRACVKVRARFQIGAIQFSPSFEVASVTLNSSSKRVHVQLPGLSSSSGEGAPVFEITNLQLDERGDISMMQLNLLGQGSKQT